MEKWKKQLRQIPWKFQAKINEALLQLFARNFSALDRKQLKAHDQIFRIRVGNYRIVYHDNGEEITIIGIPRRDENTYNDL